MTARLPDPRGYGRVVRDGGGKLVRIVEEKDATPDEQRASTRSTPASTAARRASSSRRSQSLAQPTTRRASSTSPTSWSAPPRELRRRHRRRRRRRGHGRATIASSWPRADRVMRLRLAEALMRAGVTVRDPERLLRRARRRGRPRQRARPRRRAARPTSRSAAAAASSRARCSPTAPSATACTSSPTASLAESDGRPTARRSGPGAHLRPGTRARGRGAPRQLRRDQEDAHGPGRQGQPPHLPRRRRHRRRGQRRLRHHHLQLRRLRQVRARSSRTAPSSAPTRSWWRRSPSAPARSSPPAPPSIEDVPPGALALTRPELVVVAGWAERKRQDAGAQRAPSRPGGQARARRRESRQATPKQQAASRKPTKPRQVAATGGKGKPTRRRG